MWREEYLFLPFVFLKTTLFLALRYCPRTLSELERVQQSALQSVFFFSLPSFLLPLENSHERGRKKWANVRTRRQGRTSGARYILAQINAIYPSLFTGKKLLVSQWDIGTCSWTLTKKRGGEVDQHCPVVHAHQQTPCQTKRPSRKRR